MEYLPSLSKALSWCKKAGVNFNWGSKAIKPDVLNSFSKSFHTMTPKLKSTKQIVIHRSGFTCGNVPFFRWYHRVINGWNDIGYHFVIGNGRQNYSVNGAVELGRSNSLAGSHCKHFNSDSISICLIDNPDHFKKRPPSNIELLALENTLLFLIDKIGVDVKVCGHSELSHKKCPGNAIPIEDIAKKAKVRKKRIRHKESKAKTLDLRASFKSKTIDFTKPEIEIKKLFKNGITRVVYPYHWRIYPWENLSIATRWVNECHNYNIDLLLYTGPFGTEKIDFIKNDPKRSEWLQRDEDKSIANYDTNKSLLMFCPTSRYLSQHRLSVIFEFLNKTKCDGLFFDIPWVMPEACFCSKCQAADNRSKNSLLSYKESIVRDALASTILSIRKGHPLTWFVANVGAPSIWPSIKVGASPLSLNGLFDELLIEWRPSSRHQIDSIKDSIGHTRALCPSSRISYCIYNSKNESIDSQLQQISSLKKAGKWLFSFEK